MNALNTTTPRDAFLEMVRVIHALIRREMTTRFGKQKLGYLWALFEPLLLMTILILIFTYLKQRQGIPGAGIAQFYMTGLVPFLMFRKSLNQINRSIVGNKALLVFPQIQFLDLALARFILEIATGFSVFVILITGIYLTGFEEVSVEFPLGVLGGIALLSLFGLGAGMILGALIPLFPVIEPMSHAVLGRPLFFVSGIFFTADMLPEPVRTYLLYNPLFHVVEFIRSCYFIQYESRYFDAQYVAIWVLVLLFLGLLMLRALRKEILKR